MGLKSLKLVGSAMLGTLSVSYYYSVGRQYRQNTSSKKTHICYSKKLRGDNNYFMGIFACGDDRCNICYKRPKCDCCKKEIYETKIYQTEFIRSDNPKIDFY